MKKNRHFLPKQRPTGSSLIIFGPILDEFEIFGHFVKTKKETCENFTSRW